MQMFKEKCESVLYDMSLIFSCINVIVFLHALYSEEILD